jgi:hypothetical protein
MARLLPVAAFLLSTAAAAFAAPVPGTPADPTRERDGLPLPPGATARLGSAESFAPDRFLGPTFSPDGRRLFATTQDGRVFSWDAELGKYLRSRQFPVGEIDPGGCYGVVAGERVVWIMLSR